MVKLSKKTAWIGTIVFLIGFITTLIFGIIKSSSLVTIVGLTGSLVYGLALAILIFDYYITKPEETKQPSYVKTR